VTQLRFHNQSCDQCAAMVCDHFSRAARHPHFHAGQGGTPRERRALRPSSVGDGNCIRISAAAETDPAICIEDASLFRILTGMAPRFSEMNKVRVNCEKFGNFEGYVIALQFPSGLATGEKNSCKVFPNTMVAAQTMPIAEIAILALRFFSFFTMIGRTMASVYSVNAIVRT